MTTNPFSMTSRLTRFHLRAVVDSRRRPMRTQQATTRRLPITCQTPSGTTPLVSATCIPASFPSACDTAKILTRTPHSMSTNKHRPVHWPQPGNCRARRFHTTTLPTATLPSNASSSSRVRPVSSLSTRIPVALPWRIISSTPTTKRSKPIRRQRSAALSRSTARSTLRPLKPSWIASL